ncbi:MAG TPA: hypothetical protein VEA80_02305 [Vitreimonas sp.]|uniref:hypothetical protein n=1 Tax=Vitreimonas sp. TaxID=3069702 RepID=UPI002D2B88D4|nr:hypothetical protein [Vitreimonas sp.]HYD86282.1 hypothetical protein [Vitreimonas sp.]
MSGSPTAADRKCLEAFFRDLQQTSTKVQKVRVGNALWVVACNHIVVFSGNLRRVIDVLPV